ncbi:MAG: hypothetical protein M3Y66_09740 [Actinomycetota bacterium]|nr:hypothetical protein [Actinomycetota bacterium]
MPTPIWRGLALQQEGVLARRQLNALGLDSDRVRNALAAERWQELSPTVVCSTTGALTRRQWLWFGALHAGGDALVGGLSAAEVHGLRNWHRDEITVLVDDEVVLDDVRGVDFVRTRRSLDDFRYPGSDLPLARLEPAVLLYAGYTQSQRTALGLLAACVQQRLTTPERLLAWLVRMRPLRRARAFRAALAEMDGGAQSLAELDVARMCRRHGLPRPARQVRRRDAGGRLRFTDCEWRLPDGRSVVLEVDGGFHMEVEHWEDDLVRQRALSAHGRLVVRATARELRDEDYRVAQDLIRLGVRGRVPDDAV